MVVKPSGHELYIYVYEKQGFHRRGVCQAMIVIEGLYGTWAYAINNYTHTRSERKSMRVFTLALYVGHMIASESRGG
jgi:hypothetical protein